MGVEFYRLTVLDLLTQLLVILCLDVWRVKCFAKLEFNIPKHVLDIVYSQTICWMGLFFAPLLSLITLIKLLLLFYIRLTYLKNLCQPTKTFYEVENEFFLKIFLIKYLFYRLRGPPHCLTSFCWSLSCSPSSRSPTSSGRWPPPTLAAPSATRATMTTTPEWCGTLWM